MAGIRSLHFEGWSNYLKSRSVPLELEGAEVATTRAFLLILQRPHSTLGSVEAHHRQSTKTT